MLGHAVESLLEFQRPPRLVRQVVRERLEVVEVSGERLALVRLPRRQRTPPGIWRDIVRSDIRVEYARHVLRLERLVELPERIPPEESLVVDLAVLLLLSQSAHQFDECRRGNVELNDGW